MKIHYIVRICVSSPCLASWCLCFSPWELGAQQTLLYSDQWMSRYTFGMFSSAHLQHNPQVSVFGNVCCFLYRRLSLFRVYPLCSGEWFWLQGGRTRAAVIMPHLAQVTQGRVSLRRLVTLSTTAGIYGKADRGQRSSRCGKAGRPLTLWYHGKNVQRGRLPNNSWRPATRRNYGGWQVIM